MTDRTNHRAAAERMLADADEWTAQAGELSPEASELSCLAYAGVHALLAIHDTLTAADRYAANEAKQREEDEPEMSEAAEWLSRGGSDPLDEDDHRDRSFAWAEYRKEYQPNPRELTAAHKAFLAGWEARSAEEAECSRCGEIYPGTAEATMEHHRACTGETPENPMGDPLDENDHRDRLGRDGDRVQCEVDADGWLVKPDGRPVYIAPDTTPDGAGDAPEALLCPECGHDIDEHDVGGCQRICCDCPRTPEDVARALIADAVKAERGGRRG